MAAPLIRLEVNWQGSFLYGEKHPIASVELKQDHSRQFFLHLLAKINNKLPPEEEQPLSFTVKQQSDNYVRKRKTYLYRQFDCPADLIKELKLSLNVRVRGKKTSSQNVNQRRTTVTQITVPLSDIPALDPLEAYQINITHAKDHLQACLIKKVHTAALPLLMQEADPPIGLQKANEQEAEIEKEPEWDVCSYVCSLALF